MKPAKNGLRGLRYRRRLTMKQLAARLRVEPKMVSAWETGERFPTDGQMRNLARTLGVSNYEIWVYLKIKPGVIKWGG